MSAVASLARDARLVARSIAYETQKQLAFRVGFVVREVLRGVARPLVMIAVYYALYHQDGVTTIGSYAYPDMARYMILVAVLQRLVFSERSLDLADSIFNGTLTKFLVMPFRFYLLPFSRWVQFTLMQSTFALALWSLGALFVPRGWPFPASPAAAGQAFLLVVLGSYAYFLVVFILNTLAFWLDVVWTLLVMARFVNMFIAGVLIPVTVMPEGLRRTFEWLFPYWTITAPIEIWMGKQGTPEFLHGLAVLAVSIAVLEIVRIAVWKRGVRRYSGSGM